MIRHVKMAMAALAMCSLAACATGIHTQMGHSQDNRLTIYQVNAIPPGGAEGKVQTALLIQDNVTHQWTLKMGSESYKLSRDLIENLLNPAVYAQLIAGRYGISIADRAACHSTICGGTIINNDGTAVSGSLSSTLTSVSTSSNSSSAAAAGSGQAQMPY